MSKSEITQKLEKSIHSATNKQGIFNCFEVTIGWYGNERVDYLTYDTKGTWRCYEVKSSLADFNSAAKHTFVGHFNYYVMTSELYEQVKDTIPNHIGVYIYGSSVKKAKRQELSIDEKVLIDSLIRCLSRDVEKLSKSNDIGYTNRMNREISRLRKERDNYKRDYQELRNKLYFKLGRNWQDILDDKGDVENDDWN